MSQCDNVVTDTRASMSPEETRCNDARLWQHDRGWHLTVLITMSGPGGSIIGCLVFACHCTADATFHTRHLIFSSLGAATGEWLLLSGSDEYSVARFLSLIPHKQIIQNTDSRLDEGVTKIFWNDFNLLHNIIDRLYHCFWPDLWCFLPPNLLRCHDASACHEISPWQSREGGHGRGRGPL